MSLAFITNNLINLSGYVFYFIHAWPKRRGQQTIRLFDQNEVYNLYNKV